MKMFFLDIQLLGQPREWKLQQWASANYPVFHSGIRADLFTVYILENAGLTVDVAPTAADSAMVFPSDLPSALYQGKTCAFLLSLV